MRNHGMKVINKHKAQDFSRAFSFTMIEEHLRWRVK